MTKPPSELLWNQVRCPMCQNVFNAHSCPVCGCPLTEMIDDRKTRPGYELAKWLTEKGVTSFGGPIFRNRTTDAGSEEPT